MKVKNLRRIKKLIIFSGILEQVRKFESGVQTENAQA